MAAAFEPFFTTLRPGALGQRLCIWHGPGDAAPHALVVHVHAFAEEMNKSRRMVAAQSRALATAGFAVLQMDLLGCGDSAGDFGDASWDAWRNDVLAAIGVGIEQVQRRWPGAQPALWMWGLRAGCLLACEAAALWGRPCNLLLWQPALQGRTVLQQFLRLDTVALALRKEASPDKPGAKAMLAAGQMPEVAGYRLSPALASGLEAARLHLPSNVTAVRWLDVQPDAGAGPTPAAAQLLREWSQSGADVGHRQVQGPGFWQTTEIEDVPALIGETLTAMGSVQQRTVAPQTDQVTA